MADFSSGTGGNEDGAPPSRSTVDLDGGRAVIRLAAATSSQGSGTL
ncbi:DUF6191 domain-containing protein [Streptomyces sp. NPDC051020]